MYVHTQCIKHICVVIVMDVYIYIIYMCKCLIPCNNHLLRIVTKLKTVTLVNINDSCHICRSFRRKKSFSVECWNDF